MVFTSTIFLLWFLPCLMIGYFFVDQKYKNLFLFLMSVLFYSWGGGIYAIFLLFSVKVNLEIAKYIEKHREGKKRAALIAGLVFDIGVLMFFKYTNFIIENINGILTVLNIHQKTIQEINIIMPIGISFFSFQIISYIIDVYLEKVEAQKSYINLGLYIMLFPQLIAGPIVRYIDVEREIQSRDIGLNDFRIGLKRFIIGLAKKVFFANLIGEVADVVFNNFQNINCITAWVGIIAYALQIYYDFSAYSDMAIGLGRMFGFHFLENFEYPYISRSIQEFWRRWHISLSTWFKDYVYIPLGGNRKGKLKTYRNLIIVFFLTGLWHGASWNFIIWGIYHGCFLIMERIGLKKVLERIPSILQRLYTLVVVLVGWVFFRADNLNIAVQYLKTMISFNGVTRLPYAGILLTPLCSFAILLGFIFCMPTADFISRIGFRRFEDESVNAFKISDGIYDGILVILFVLSLAFITGSDFNPFIYFRF